MAARALASERHLRRPISAIAYSLGFKDAAHFSRRFRSTYRVPPHLWRREAQQQRGGDARDLGTWRRSAPWRVSRVLTERDASYQQCDPRLGAIDEGVSRLSRPTRRERWRVRRVWL
jgi:AraC-like DNA-binding protein